MKKEHPKDAPSVEIADILQFCCMNGLTGIIEVRESSSTGRIYLDEGKIVDAVTEEGNGEDALFRLVNSTTRDLEFQETIHDKEPTIHKEWEYLLLEAARIRDVHAHDGPAAVAREGEGVPAGCRLLLVPQSSVVTVKCNPSANKETKKVPSSRDVTLLNSRLATAGLQPGSDLFIQLDGKGRQFKCKLIGLDPGAYVVVSFPLIRSTAKEILPGETMVVRYLWNGSVWGFRAPLLNTTLIPAPLLFLSHPDKIERYDLRDKQRIDCIIPATASLYGKEIDGIVVDIAESGCKFTHRGQLEMTIRLDDEIRLHMNIPIEDGASNVILGSIKNVTQSENKIHIGIRFISLSDAMLGAIERYMRMISLTS